MSRESMGREINGFGKKSKKSRLGEGTDPGIREAQAQMDSAEPVDFSEREITKVYKKKPSLERDVVGIKEGLEKASAMIEAERIEKGINKALEEEEKADKEQTADIKEMGETTLKQLSKEKKRKAELKKSIEEKVGEEEEVADIKRIRESIEGSATKKSSKDTRGRAFEAGSELSLPQRMAEQAQTAYVKAYKDYDAKFIAKLYKGQSSENVRGAQDLIAATRPPRLAFLTAKGRELNRLYKDMRGKIRLAGNMMDEE